MRKNQIIKILIILRHIGSVISSLEVRDIIDDDNELFTRECKFAITDNLYAMKSCLSYLEEESLNEAELNTLCESFQDYYAKGSESEDEEEEEEEEYEDENNYDEYMEYADENYDDDDDDKRKKKKKKKEKEASSNLVLIETENETLKNDIPMIQMTNITHEEAQVIHEVNEMMNTLEVYDVEDEDDYDSRVKKNKNNICKVRVKQWKEKCKDVSHIASIINTSLEIFYFRRESYCLKNSQNQYCEVVMDQIQDQAFNGTEKLVNPLNTDEQSKVCECYKERMIYYQEEYDFSTDPTAEKKRKHYSKNKKKPKNPNSNANANANANSNANPNANPNSNSNSNSNSNTHPNANANAHENTKKIKSKRSLTEWMKEKGEDEERSTIQKMWGVVERLIHHYLPSFSPLKFRKHGQIFPSFNELIQQSQKNQNQRMKKFSATTPNGNDHDASDNHKETLTSTTRKNKRSAEPSDSMTDEDELFIELEQLLLHPDQKMKRMESDVNIEQLKKLIIKYNNDVNQFMDVAICNITFNELGSKNAMSNDAVSLFSNYSSRYLLLLLYPLLLYLLF